MPHVPFWPPLIAAAALIVGPLSPMRAEAQNSPILPIATAGWTATDALGRTLPSYAETVGPKSDHWAG